MDFSHPRLANQQTTSNPRHRSSACSVQRRHQKVVEVAQINHTVERGAKLLRLEAMKMQSNIYAPIAGRVTKLHVTPGQHVEAKDLLVVIAP
jgi:biotin carboxyl carrier protein